MSAQVRARRLALLLAVLANVPALAQPPVSIALRSEALLSEPHIVLSDLADVDAGDAQLRRALEALPLGNAPMLGYVARRSRAELEALIKRQEFALGRRIEWQGARSVAIRRRGRPLDNDLLLAAATRYLSSAFGQKYEELKLSLAEPLQPLELPLGEVQLRVRAIDSVRPRARMAVWVDVLVGGIPYRSVLVPMAVLARQAVYVARRPMAAGSLIMPDDFAPQLLDVTAMQADPVGAGALAGARRLRHAVAQGEVLSVAQLSPAGMVLRGDRVKLVVAGEAIVVETAAYAQADASVGHMVLVKAGQGGEVVAARVVAAGVVQIDGR